MILRSADVFSRFSRTKPRASTEMNSPRDLLYTPFPQSKGHSHYRQRPPLNQLMPIYFLKTRNEIFITCF